MLTFKNVTQRCTARLRRYYANCPYELCEYSAGVKLMWRERLHSAFAEYAGCLIVRSRYDGRFVFDYPVPGAQGDVEAALTAIEEYCTETGIHPVFSSIPADRSAPLLLRYPHTQVTSLSLWQDYLYVMDDLAFFPGRRYSGQRNHVNKFFRLCPNAVFRPLGAADGDLIARFWSDYESEFHKTSASAKSELRCAKDILRCFDKPWFCVGGMYLDGRLLSLSLGERCGSTLIIHVEKALYSYEGVYPATVQAFARHFGAGMHYVNREDDAGDKGLRTSKQQYLPAKMGQKLFFSVFNELHSLREIPALSTDRLTLSPLREEDKGAYNALCLDDERNRWWGYDYRKDLRGEWTEDYFLSVAREDFRHRSAVNFAVRLDGKCIGEAVLYRFDWRGGAELGCRIAPAYAHCGYGAEAFAAVADWALYHLNLTRVVAKCYHENLASRRMLSSCMRPAGQDDTFLYFEKRV